MSHVSIINLEINSLDALRMTVERLGIVFRENQKTYQWFGRFMADYPLPEGFTAADLGKCDHAIHVPGAQYEIGVVERNGKISLLWDFWQDGGLERIIGQGGAKIRQLYPIEEAKLEAERRGYSYSEEVQENGDIELEIEVN